MNFFLINDCCDDRQDLKNTIPLGVKKGLKMYAETRYVRSSEFDEIYFGGGIPSVMSSEITDLLSYCERNFNISGDRMVKITGCTHNFHEKKLESMSDFEVDQLDLGIQTFDDDIRKMLNLRDNAGEAERTVGTARKLGLRVSIYLTYNLPGQTMEVWRKDIQKALELDVESVDCYPLDIHPGTTLAKQLQSGEVQLYRRLRYRDKDVSGSIQHVCGVGV